MSRILNATTMRNILGVVLAISAWQVFAIISDTPLIPGLERIVAELLYMLRDGTIAHHALSSLATGGAGLCLALVVAAVLGVGAGRNWVVDAAIHPLVTLLYPVPKLALYPLIILLLGIGWPSRKKPPLGPSSGRVAAQTMPEAPSSTVRSALEPPISVRTQPGQTELTKIL